MNNKILTIFIIFIFIILAGCISSQNYQMGGGDKSLVSDTQYSLIGKPSIDGNVNGKTLPERKVISTATLTIEVASVQVAINDITNITLETGGFISSSSISDVGSNRKNGHFTEECLKRVFIQLLKK